VKSFKKKVESLKIKCKVMNPGDIFEI
jgi:hypothetical protein